MQPGSRKDRFSEAIAFLAPFLLLLSLGLADGGFGLEARHVAGIASWIVVIALLATGAASNVAIGRPAYWAFGLIVALAALTIASSIWSGSVERSFAEGGRVLTYLGFFVAALLVTRTEKLRQRFAEGLTLSIAVLALLGVASRLLPELLTVTNEGAERTRLRFPLGYWNANGVTFGIGLGLLAWMRGQGSSPALKWFALAAMPAAILALYLTYSRGGILAGLVTIAVLIAISEDRLRHAIVALGALIAAVPAVLAVRARAELADGTFGDAMAAQGLEVLAVLVAGTAVLLGVAWLLQRAVRGRLRDAERRATELSRAPAFLRVAGGLAAVIGVLAVGIVGSQTVEEFSDFDPEEMSQSSGRLDNFSGAGRHDFWRVALVGLAENPALGTGAGTYSFTWREERELGIAVQDAHSVYLEALSELGVPGGLLTMAMFLALLAIGFLAWSRSLRGDRERLAAMLAIALAFAVAAGIDWMWEMAAVSAIFFMAAGVLVGARCGQIAISQGIAPERDRPSVRYGLALGGIALGWISIAVLVGPLLMQMEIGNSQQAAARGDFDSAVDHATTARSLQPWAATPYIQLAGLAQLQDEPDIALDHYDEAAERESANWQIWYFGSQAAEEAGEEETARVWLERARELNPKAEEFEPEQ